MEHASIAAFARFTLELLAFGAPAELVASASRAMADEVEHARQAFAFASAYAAEPLGPGPLSIDGSLDRSDLDSSVVTAFLEGCIGETVAALEAREAAEGAADPVVRRALAKVADDEARHALLAYQFLRWALPRATSAGLGAKLREALDAECARAQSAVLNPTPATVRSSDLAKHGILSPHRCRELRCAVLNDVVGPCLEALLAEPISAARGVAEFQMGMS
jgi:hypothetical protein